LSAPSASAWLAPSRNGGDDDAIAAAGAAVPAVTARRSVGFVAAVFGIVLSDCQGHRVEATETAKPSIYGMTKEQLIVCMGKPNIRVVVGNEEMSNYATYSKSGGTECSTTLRFVDGLLRSVQSNNLVTDDRKCDGVFFLKCLH
jgi:hypothetical protein